MAERFDYQKYLASREWALLKEQVRERCKGFCERCGVAPYEETHHVTYERIGREKLDDLQAVCSACHAFVSAHSDYDPISDVAFVVIAISRKNPPSIPGVRQVGFYRPSEKKHYVLKVQEHLKAWAPADAEEFNG